MYRIFSSSSPSLGLAEQDAISRCRHGNLHSHVSHTQGFPEVSAPRHCSRTSQARQGLQKAGWVLSWSFKMHKLEQHHEVHTLLASAPWDCCRVCQQSQALQDRTSRTKESNYALWVTHSRRGACRGASVAVCTCQPAYIWLRKCAIFLRSILTLLLQGWQPVA